MRYVWDVATGPPVFLREQDFHNTNEVIDARRVSCYFMSIPAAKEMSKQLAFASEWRKDRRKVFENK